MKKIIKYYRQLVLMITLFLTYPLKTAALPLPRTDEQARSAADRAGLSGTESGSLLDLVGTLISAVLYLLGVIFLILIIYAGYLWMSSAGREESVTKAKKILTGAAIGLLIVFAAYAISTFVLTQIISSAT